MPVRSAPDVGVRTSPPPVPVNDPAATMPTICVVCRDCVQFGLWVTVLTLAIADNDIGKRSEKVAFKVEGIDVHPGR